MTTELVTQYQEAIDEFVERLECIDAKGGTYAKIHYADVRSRSLRVRGTATKPHTYTREIEIDDIVLEYSADIR